MPSKGKLRPREIKLQARVSQPIHGRNGVKKKYYSASRKVELER